MCRAPLNASPAWSAKEALQFARREGAAKARAMIHASHDATKDPLARNLAPAPGANGAAKDRKYLAQALTGQCRSASGEDRATILDALRTPVASDLGTLVEFVVRRTRICGDWAFVIATPQKKGGGAIRWTGTVCAGDTSHLAGGLLRRSGATWTLVGYALCPSDVAWSDWPEKFNAPQALFDE